MVESHIMTRAHFAYYKEKLADAIVRHIKDIIADATQLTDDNISFLSYLTTLQYLTL